MGFGAKDKLDDDLMQPDLADEAPKQEEAKETEEEIKKRKSAHLPVIEALTPTNGAKYVKGDSLELHLAVTHLGGRGGSIGVHARAKGPGQHVSKADLRPELDAFGRGTVTMPLPTNEVGPIHITYWGDGLPVHEIHVEVIDEPGKEEKAPSAVTPAGGGTDDRDGLLKPGD